MEELESMIPVDLTTDDIWDPRTIAPDPKTDQTFLRTCEVTNHVAARPSSALLLRGPGEHGHDAANPIREVAAMAVETAIRQTDVESLISKFCYRPRRVVEQTLANTTALAKNTFRQPFRNHLKSRFPQLNVRRQRETVASDTFFASEPAIGGYTCAQLFVGLESHAVEIYLMRAEREGPIALQDFIRQIGAPRTLRTDNSKMQLGREWVSLCRRMVIRTETIEPHQPQQNHAERMIGELKRQTDIILNRTGAPDRFWGLAIQYAGYVWNKTSHEALGWKTPLEKRDGDTPDISELLMFDFYQPVHFMDPSVPFPANKERTGRFVGFAQDIGDRLCYKIYLPESDNVLSRSTVRPATDGSRLNLRYNTPLTSTGTPKTPPRRRAPDDGHDPSSPHRGPRPTPCPGSPQKPDLARWQEKVGVYDPFTRVLIHTEDATAWQPASVLPGENRNHTHTPDSSTSPTLPGQHSAPLTGDARFYHEEALPSLPFRTGSAPVTDHPDPVDLVNKLFAISYKGEPRGVRVTRLYRDPETGESAVEVKVKSNNATQQMLYSRFLDLLDPNVHPFIAVVGHRTIDPHRRRWEVKVLWGTGETTWEPLTPMFEQDPVTVAAYARRHGITDLPGWRRTKRVRGDPDRVVRLARALHANAKASSGPKIKFGVTVPKTIAEARRLDEANGDTKWGDAIAKELGQIDQYGTFRTVPGDERLPREYQRIPYHMVFDVKFDLRRKARLVAGGNMTAPPKEDVYSGVVGMEGIRLGFTLASLFGLDVCAADVGNAFLYGRTREKVFVVAGPEFGPEREGKRLEIVKALYGLRSSSARFHEAFADTLRRMGFRPSMADSDLWLRERGDHYEYIATYVDDVLAFAREPRQLIDTIEKEYTLKGVGTPVYYLGANVLDLVEWGTQEVRYGLSSETYINRIVQEFEKTFGTLPLAKTPLPESYRPEEDDTPLLSRERASLYRSMTGALNWIVTIGRIDLAYTNQLMARYNAIPRADHLDKMKRVFGYAKRYPRGKIVFDARPMSVDHVQLTEHQTWGQFYPDAKEELPDNAPNPKGKTVTITAYVDADHATCTETRRSTTGVIIFVGRTPVKWVSKRQPTVETSTHGSELVAAKVAVEAIIEIRYKLRMLGIQVQRPSTMLGDNNAVVVNVTTPSSTLRKKHNAVAFHKIREAVAAGITLMGHVSTGENLSDLLTKILGKMKHFGFAKPLVFRNPDFVTDQ